MTIKKRIIRSAYGPKLKVALHTPKGGPGGAKQSFKKECDINHIMARFVKTGVRDHLNANKAEYGFAPAVDFHTAQNLLVKAKDQFAGLSAAIRKQFSNDPGKFLAFCETEANRSEMALMGLLDDDATAAEADKAKASDSASAPLAPNPADIEPRHESA